LGALPDEVGAAVKFGAGVLGGQTAGGGGSGARNVAGRAGGGGGEAETATERIGADGLEGGDQRGGALIGLLWRGHRGVGGAEETDEGKEEREKAGFHGGWILGYLGCFLVSG
jgi:hypothetical protein